MLAWFGRTLDQPSIDAYLAILEADPNWSVFTRRWPDQVEIELHYAPTGTRLFLRPRGGPRGLAGD